MSIIRLIIIITRLIKFIKVLEIFLSLYSGLLYRSMSHINKFVVNIPNIEAKIPKWISIKIVWIKNKRMKLLKIIRFHKLTESWFFSYKLKLKKT